MMEKIDSSTGKVHATVILYHESRIIQCWFPHLKHLIETKANNIGGYNKQQNVLYP